MTGGLASGKTTVCGFLKARGAYVLCADDIVHELLSPQTDLGKKVRVLLGDEVLSEGKFDREAIASKVFHKRELLYDLERLLHPEVQRRVDTMYKELLALRAPPPLFVVEMPLLYEAGYEGLYDAVIVVASEGPKRVLSHERERAARLLPLEEKRRRADFVIENRGSLEDLRREVDRIFEALKEKRNESRE